MLAAGDAANRLCSPFVVTQAVTALASGAGGATAAAFDETLGCSGAAAAAQHRLGQRWIEAAGAETQGTGTDAPEHVLDLGVLHVATGLWARVPIVPEFRDAFSDMGFGRLGIDDPDAWVAEQTSGRIASLAVPTDAGTLAVLVAVLDVAAAWLEPFAPHHTTTGGFTRADGSSVDVPLMHTTRKLACSKVRRVQRVDLPLRSSAQGPRLAVRFALGRPHAEPADVIDALLAPRPPDATDWRRVELTVPRFEIDRRGAGLSLVEPLVDLGLEVAFRGDATFDGLSPEPLTISDAIQQAWFEIDEAGARGTATAEVAMMRGRVVEDDPPLVVRLDRPFAFAVLLGDDPLLFAGWVGDPSAG